jgi:hypothetical protein
VTKPSQATSTLSEVINLLPGRNRAFGELESRAS